MAYRIKATETMVDAVRRIAKEQVKGALAAINDAEMATEDRVHDVRKRCKKIRALLRLVRPSLGSAFQQENEWFRDTARLLSEIRDSRTVVQTFDALIEHFTEQVNPGAFVQLRDKLSTHRECLEDEEIVTRQLQAAHQRLAESRDRIKKWSLDGSGFDCVRGGIAKTYGRARKDLAQAADQASPEAYHEFRKRVKYHWYHCRLISGVWPQAMEVRQEETHRLADLLGEDHDLAVLGWRLQELDEPADDEQSTQALLGLVDQRRAELEQNCLPLARRLFAEQKGDFSQRIATYWEAWQSEQPDA